MTETETATLPRSLKELTVRWNEIIGSEAAKKAQTADNIYQLMDQARPHNLLNLITGTQGMVFPNGECLITANLRSRPTKNPEHRGNNGHTGVVTVHPAVAAVYDTAATTNTLLIGLQRADEAADWNRATAIGTALLEVFRRKGNYPQQKNIDQNQVKRSTGGGSPTLCRNSTSSSRRRPPSTTRTPAGK